MKASLLATSLAAFALSVSAGEWKFPCPENEIESYTAYHIRQPVKVDGKLDEPFWRLAPTSPRFKDIITGGPTLHDTRVTVVWDDENLYLGYRVEEPFVRATLTKHNAPVWQENDVEFFVAGRDSYFEFEINALNTTYEMFFIWEDAYDAGGFSSAPEFARSQLKPFNGVGFSTHPRGNRLRHPDWPFPGLRTAVFVDGTLNNDSDHDRGWTVELAFPWRGMKWLAKSDNRAQPPRDGDEWRMDFSRFNSYKEAPPVKDSGGWVWTRHGVWDSHIPECFARIRFSTNDVSIIPVSTSISAQPPSPK